MHPAQLVSETGVEKKKKVLKEKNHNRMIAQAWGWINTQMGPNQSILTITV